METEDSCSKCGGALVDGFILDRGHYDSKRRQVWVGGAPESSFWSGLKTSDGETFYVRVFRCTECSFLEFYTAEKADLGGLFN